MTQSQSAVRGILSGVAAGVSAAFLMNCFQIAWGKASEALSDDSEDQESGGKSREAATVRAVEKFQGMVSGRPLPEGERQVAGNLLHYGFGALLGAVYELAGRRFPELRAGYGTLYGGGVAIVADEMLVPAAGLSPPPTQAPAWSHFYGLVSHLAFGAALEGSRRLIERVPKPERPTNPERTAQLEPRKQRHRLERPYMGHPEPVDLRRIADADRRRRQSVAHDHGQCGTDRGPHPRQGRSRRAPEGGIGP